MNRSLTHYYFLVGLPVLVFSAFLTEIKLIPAIANNVGLFEVLGALSILVFLIDQRQRPTIRPTITIAGLLALVAAVSLVNIEYQSIGEGLIQVSILVFLFLLLLAMFNLLVQHELDPEYLLRLITYATAIVGPWILQQGFLFEEELDAVGPFRNRAHMGIYMLTAFWLVLIYTFWPGRSRRNRVKWILGPAAIGLCLYAVAISGRRSVYLSLFIGLIALVAVFVVVLRRRRLAVGFAAAFSVAFLALLYTQGASFLPRGDFFRTRVGLVGTRLRSAADAIAGESETGFMALQTQAVNAAFRTHPLLGIGWGSFHEWELNVTRHEVHSTPLRFLAETGLVGFVLYATLLLHLLSRSAALLLRMRSTAFAGSYLVLAVGIWSLAVSYAYNRHITERTFYLLLIVFLVMDAFAARFPRSTGTPERSPEASSVPGRPQALTLPRSGDSGSRG
jgi:hypothetical protein